MQLPISGRSSQANVRKIGASLGTFIEVDVNQNCELDRAIRIRVIHDVQKPLKAAIPIKMKEGKVVHFDVKYERLPIFCYGCGVMGHGEKDCEDGPYEEDELPYGEWLRASPWKVTKTKADGNGKARRDLNGVFDAEKKREADKDISLMIERLQSIAIDLKARKGRGRKEREEQVGDRREHQPIIPNVTIGSEGNGGNTNERDYANDQGITREGGNLGGEEHIGEMRATDNMVMVSKEEPVIRGHADGVSDRGIRGGKKREWKKQARVGVTPPYTGVPLPRTTLAYGSATHPDITGVVKSKETITEQFY